MAEAPKKAPRRTGQPLSNMEKAAALLLCMDKPLVNRIVKHFDEAEVQIVAQAAARLGSLPQPYVDELIDEFATAIAAGHDIQGTPQTAAQLLDGVVASEQLTDIMSDIAGNASSRVWSSLAAVPDTALVQYLSKQHPQIVTYILSRLTGSLVATVLEQLPVALRVQIMRRMLTLKEIAPVPLRFLEINLQLDLVSKAARNSAPDVHARIAAVLNKMNRETADAAFSGLSSSRPKDAEKIKGLLFTFNDIAKLSEDSRTKLFEGIPVEQTIAALHGANADFQQLILGVLSQRSKRMIEGELQNGRAASKAEIGKAQRAIADRALELVDRGVIELGGDS